VRRGGVHGPQRAEVPQGEELPGFVQVQGGQVHQRQRLARGEHEVVDVAQVAEQAADQGRVGEVGRPRAGAKRQLRQRPVDAGRLPGDDGDLGAARAAAFAVARPMPDVPPRMTTR